jgi:hypothetical protein
MVLGHKPALKGQEAKTDTIVQPDSAIMLEIMNPIKQISESQYPKPKYL